MQLFAEARTKILKLPSAERAVVPERKIVDYLLSDTHPRGRSKAVFFRGLGFFRDDPERLRAALVEIAVSTDMMESAFAFGTKYVGIGDIVAPNGNRARVTTVWVIRETGAPPVFVTAYPG